MSKIHQSKYNTNHGVTYVTINNHFDSWWPGWKLLVFSIHESCLKDSYNFTKGFFLRNVEHIHTKYGICPSFPFEILCYKVVTNWRLVTSNDRWSLSIIISHLFSCGGLQTIYDIMQPLPPNLEISCLHCCNNLTPNERWLPPITIDDSYLFATHIHPHEW